MNFKKSILLAVLLGGSGSVVNADFIGSAIGTVTGSSSKAIGGITSGGIGGLQSKAMDWAQTTAVSGATSFLFDSDASSGIWDSLGGTFATGTIEMCYKRGKLKSSVTPDFCSMLGNTDISACSLLPSTLGNGTYIKKSKTEQAGAKAPLNDWCKKYVQSEAKVTAGEIKDYMGLSGKKPADIKATPAAPFSSPAKKAAADKAASLTDYLDNTSKATAANTPKNGGGAYSKKYRKLQESGLGYIADKEVKKIASLNKDVTTAELENIGTKIVFATAEEYKNDLNEKVSSDAVVERQFFNFATHVDVANGQFGSFNKQKKTLTDKKSFVDDYIENETSGLRKQYYTWADEMAGEEIMNTLPRKGEKYYSSFDEKNIMNNVSSFSRDKDVMISVANYEIVRQQYDEKDIMLKWRAIADEKADDLKSLLYKNMYASEVFDEALARQQIQQLLAAE